MPPQKSSRKRVNLPYSEGDVFSVPLRDGRFAWGGVARLNGNGGVLGYFFGPPQKDLATLQQEDFNKVGSNDAVLIGQFGDLGILEGDWLILDHLEAWDRNEWLVPVFVRGDASDGYFISYYNDELEVVREERAVSIDTSKYAEDGLWGYGAVEIVLTKLFTSMDN